MNMCVNLKESDHTECQFDNDQFDKTNRAAIFQQQIRSILVEIAFPIENLECPAMSEVKKSTSIKKNNVLTSIWFSCHFFAMVLLHHCAVHRALERSKPTSCIFTNISQVVANK